MLLFYVTCPLSLTSLYYQLNSAPIFFDRQYQNQSGYSFESFKHLTITSFASFPIFRDYEILFTDYTLSTPWYASVESLVHPCKQNINQQITNINCDKAENSIMKRSLQI
jgi:hypothetical protein